VQLDVYRSCSFKEKREVLGVFWRSSEASSNKIAEAALQYGVVALPCLAIVGLELMLFIALAIERGETTGWIAGVFEVVVIVSIVRAVRRLKLLRLRVTN
jgi:hypothetical protein